MVFYTESSAYEIDLQTRRIRRLRGAADPQPRQGSDGVWKTYARIIPEIPTQGYSVLIIWALTGTGPSTMTSVVNDVVPEEN